MAALNLKTDETEALKQDFFQAMSFAASTVNVITTDGMAGKAGVTVSAMSSVSADTPRPTLLVCINERSAAAEKVLKNGVFCVNILRDHQSYISDVFAGRYNNEIDDKFSCTEWVKGKSNAPRVADALVAFDCRIVSTQKVGTHYVVFGEVEELAVGDKGSALIYANRSYGSSMPLHSTSVPDHEGGVKPDTLSLACFHTFGPYIVPRLVKTFVQDNPSIEVKVVEGDNRRVKEALLAGEVEAALMYDYDLSPGFDVTPLTELKPYVLLSDGHPLANKAVLTPEDLSGEPMVSVTEESSRELLEGFLKSSDIKPNVIFRASSFEMMRGMVGHGMGFAIVIVKPATTHSYDGMPLVSRELEINGDTPQLVLAQKKGVDTPSSQSILATVKNMFEGAA